jgi:hypothetical protein
MKPNFWARKLFDFDHKVLFEVWTKSGTNLVSFCMNDNEQNEANKQLVLND